MSSAVRVSIRDRAMSMSGSLYVFTFKEGMLARAAHDLRLSLERFQVSLAGETLFAVFEMGSLRVEGAVHDGKLDSNALSAGDRLEIERVIRSKILAVDRYPEARLEARVREQGSIHSVEGELELLGQRRRIAFDARPEAGAGNDWQAEIELVPSRWGIHPYSALLGAIRLADRIRVVARLQSDV